MTEEHDKQLSRLFHDAFEDFEEEEFKSRVMEQVQRYERRSALFRYLVGFGVLVLVWFAAPEIQNAAMLVAVSPLEVSPTFASEGVTLALRPLLTMLGTVCAGYFLISFLSNGSKGIR